MMNLFLQVTTSISTLIFPGPELVPDTIGPLPEPVTECSGITPSSSGGFWVINDSAHPPLLYQLDENGAWITETLVRDTKNVDWEALARDEKGNLWIGDIGNNKNSRKDLALYRFPEPEYLKTSAPSRYPFFFPEQDTFPEIPEKRHWDAESMILWKGRCFILSKNRTNPFDGYVRAYEVPIRDSGTVRPAIFMDSLWLGDGPREEYWITDAALSPNQKALALLSFGKMWLILDMTLPDLLGGRIVEIPFSFKSQKEAICFTNDSTLVLADEKFMGTGGYLYSVNISKILRDHIKVRQNEVSVKEKVFKDSVTVDLNLSLRGHGLYEFFDYEGNRIAFGKLGLLDRGNHSITLFPEIELNGTYLLNIILADRPHGFVLKRFVEMTPEEIIEKGENSGR